MGVKKLLSLFDFLFHFNFSLSCGSCRTLFVATNATTLACRRSVILFVLGSVNLLNLALFETLSHCAANSIKDHFDAL